MTVKGKLNKKQKTIIAVFSTLGALLAIVGLWLFLREKKTTVKRPQSNKHTNEGEDGVRENQVETPQKDAEKQRKLGVSSSKTKESGDTLSSKEESEEDSQEDQPTGVKKVVTAKGTEKPTKVKSSNAPSTPLKKRKAKDNSISKSEGNENNPKGREVGDTESVTKNNAIIQANELEENAKKEIIANLQKADSVEFSNDHIRASHLSLLSHKELVKLLERVQATAEKKQGHFRNSVAYVNNIMLLANAIKYTAPDYPYKDLVKPWMQSDYRLYNSKEFAQIVQRKDIPGEELKEIVSSSCLYYMMRVANVKELSPRPEEYFEASLSKFVNASFQDDEFKSAWIPIIVQYCSVSSDEEVTKLVAILNANSALKNHAMEALKGLTETSTSPNFFYNRILTSLNSS